MMKSTVLVTGGAGYVGAVLVPKLLARGYRVKVLDWYIFGDTVKKHKNLREIKGDLRDSKLVKKSLSGADAVIHLASISNDPSFELNPRLAKTINYDATCFLIDGAKRANVARFIYASSSSVYGVKRERNVTEDISLEPLTDYSKYKALCETYLLQQQSDDFIPVVLRPATVCGWSPRMRLDLTVNILTMNALVNKKIIVNGGKQKRPNIHIEDVCRAYMLMVSAPKEKIAGQIYNVGYQNYTILELAHMVRDTVGDPSVTITVAPTNDPRSYRISSDKIKKELGFVPTHTIADAIADIKKAYEHGKIPHAMSDVLYSNIKTMQELQIQ